VTGLRIDHYAEVGFGGFVGMTDAVGGVQLCPKRNINDHKSGLHVKKAARRWTARPHWRTSGPGTSTRRATSAG
jgi:anionic cell wall polymer biosynthesis LytR-Cps2A-Psr (LCP) family protein